MVKDRLARFGFDSATTEYVSRALRAVERKVDRPEPTLAAPAPSRPPLVPALTQAETLLLLQVVMARRAS